MPSFAARQAIVDKHQQIIAYELLFRDSLINVYPKVDAQEATRKLLHTVLQSRQSKTFTQQKPAFINFTTELLRQGFVLQFDPQHIVVEILETEQPTAELLALCKSLHQQGYVIALDDFTHHQSWHQFFPYIGIIKVDIKQSSKAEIADLFATLNSNTQIKLLAEKIEDQSEYQQAIEFGFDYFQGYFFSQPEIIKSRPNAIDAVSLELGFV